jgi:glucose/arabinose dehydrogenase
MSGVQPLLIAMALVLIIGVGSLLFIGGGSDGDEATGPSEDATVITLPEGVTAATTSDTEITDVAGEETVAANEDGVEISPAQSGFKPTGDREVTLPDEPLQGLAIELITTELAQPTIAVSAPGDDRLHVTERIGRIKVIDGTTVDSTSWMNITDRVFAGGIEPGLLGLAFHPEYATNGRFFAYYVNSDRQRTLSEFSGNFIEGDESSEKVLFSLDQPHDDAERQRHYGGMVQFGPDGYLYVSVGDGADARLHGQNPDTLFAAILRLDVDNGDPYAIPADNPFVNGGGAPEIYAFGVRNPWRFWIDPFDNDMYIGDVGQGDWEEVDIISLSNTGDAYNLAWANMEGTHCFFEENCDINDYVAPVFEYAHEEPPKGECSLTGGPVYRGAAIPELDGHYFFADWCRGWVKSFAYVDGQLTAETDWRSDLGEIAQINGIGTDSNGEMIIVTFDGQVLRIVPER